MLVLAALGACRQTWRDSIVLFEHALAVTERNYVAHHNLSAVLRDRNQLEQAFRHSLAALAINRTAQAHIILGGIHADLGRLDEASKCFQIAIAIDPHRVEPFNDLGAIAMERSQWLEAAGLFEKALRVNPEFFPARRNLGEALLRAGRPKESETELRLALGLMPDDPRAVAPQARHKATLTN